MPPFRLSRGRTIRRNDERSSDEQPLKTKIVATIGNRNSYKGGVYDRNGRKVEDPPYSWLVQEFYENGADVIRLNLAHLKIGQITEAFSEIKEAILNCERMNERGKKMALLADLPGPKIRFKFTKDITFTVGRTFLISFKDHALSNSRATVYVGDLSLFDSLAKSDAKSIVLRHLHIEEAADYSGMLENVLGREFASGDHELGSFARMMDRIRRKLKNEKVLVVVGDGDVFMEVKEVRETSLKCKVITVRARDKSVGADEMTIRGNKGFTLKGIDLDIPSFTEEDQDKLNELLEAEHNQSDTDTSESVLTFIALSFVQTADDILRAREYMEMKLESFEDSLSGATRLMAPSLIAKIETNKALQNEHFILDVADGIMVARGDLGLQKEIEEVPAIQKNLIRLCNKRGKPVITATEMLKSMTDSTEPTRAEGTDVFNAILDGSDAVMLSEETAQGKYPFDAIRKMICIAVHAERYYERMDMPEHLRRRANLLRIQEALNDDAERVQSNTNRLKVSATTLNEAEVSIKTARLSQTEKDTKLKSLQWRKQLYEEKWGKSKSQIATNRITQATCTMSEAEDIKCIIAASTSGRTVRMISRLRPSVLIVGAAHDAINTRKLSVSYGVLPITIHEVTADQSVTELLDQCQIKISEDSYLSSFLKRGDIAVFTAGSPLRRPGTTNLVQIIIIKGSD